VVSPNGRPEGERAEARSAEGSLTRAGREAVLWRALGSVMDPEIPVVSIVELGIVRGVRCANDGCRITLTPTYSGCPATRVIEQDVRTAASSVAPGALDVVTSLSPPWTTDWIAPEARARLAAFGIAPPHPAGGAQVVRFAARTIRCPHCGSLRTEELSRFGSTPCKAQYRCVECREPFDYFKPH
jgi:ring-1,2-phenylacetyl-CoA epoxidase subunit PaaD